MNADLIVDFKDVTPEGGIIQMRVWKVPEPVPPSAHAFKYRLYYGMRGARIVGFDHAPSAHPAMNGGVSEAILKPGAYRPHPVSWEAPGIHAGELHNERGKGDHCHLDGREYPYRFVDVEQLIEDFIAEVERRRKP